MNDFKPYPFNTQAVFLAWFVCSVINSHCTSQSAAPDDLFSEIEGKLAKRGPSQAYTCRWSLLDNSIPGYYLSLRFQPASKTTWEKIDKWSSSD